MAHILAVVHVTGIGHCSRTLWWSIATMGRQYRVVFTTGLLFVLSSKLCSWSSFCVSDHISDCPYSSERSVCLSVHVFLCVILSFYSCGICNDVLARFLFFCVMARLVSPPVSIVFNPRILLFRPWEKKRKSIEFPRPIAASLLFCSTSLRHVAIISAALSFCSMLFFCFTRHLLWLLAQFPYVSRRGPFAISARFYCLQSRTSFVSTLSKTKENHSSAQARSLPAIVLLICVIVSRPDSANLHCVLLVNKMAFRKELWSDISSSWPFLLGCFVSKEPQNGSGVEEEYPGPSKCTDESRGTSFCTRKVPDCCARK